MRRSEALEPPGRVITRFVVMAVGLAGPSCSGWAGRPHSHAAYAEYDVRVTEPGSNLVRVRAEISRDALAGAPTLRLRFRDLNRNPAALKDLHASSDDKPLPIQVGREGQDVRTITLDDPPGSVIIEYTVDPTFYPPGSTSNDPADARARLGQGMAVLRTSSILPVLDPGLGSARVTFRLPQNWVAVTPWIRDGDRFWLSSEDQTAIDYLGLGPFEFREIVVGGTSFRVAATRTPTKLGAQQVAVLIEYFMALVGTPPPQSTGPRSVVVVPSGFMSGGAAGNRSIVQGPSAVVLAHEAFHWWMHSDLVRPEARWFSEGFTNYFGVKAATEGGLITEEQASQCFSDLSGEMRFLELDGPRSLVNASADYARDSRAQRLVYSKGTLLALLLDRELMERGRSLNEVIRKILSQRRRQVTNADLRRLMVEESGSATGSSIDTFVKEATPLPQLGLGPARGSSGCARYLPGR